MASTKSGNGSNKFAAKVAPNFTSGSETGRVSTAELCDYQIPKAYVLTVR